ncbi:lactate utilization protein [Clostridium paraputrificum]|uniref:lactate utilization protein n=1 Tax=Clostridium paraputrificum TaxID=29363 RepID=UPI003D3264AB
MDKVQRWKYDLEANNIVKILKDKYYNALYCPDMNSAKEKILELIPEGSSIALGGSVTLNQLDIIATFRSEKYNLFDRYKDVPFTETVEIMRQSLLADYLVTTVNAITKDGELMVTDSTGNRAAAMIFGPRKVIIVVGVNKIVADLEEGYWRIKEVAILNAKRINHKTPCTITGNCSDCEVKDRICNFTSIIHNGRKFEDRYTIIVVPEILGY